MLAVFELRKQLFLVIVTKLLKERMNFGCLTPIDRSRAWLGFGLLLNATLAGLRRLADVL
jgi:hypothetical protein